jgi:quercetin dioxygenase-like cupin family protein
VAQCWCPKIVTSCRSRQRRPRSSEPRARGLRRRGHDPVRPVAPAGKQRPCHPRARTAWHTHPNGQTIYVTEGIGLAQRRGGPIEVIRPGDRVFFEPGEDHWHGAAPNRFMTHLAVLEVDDKGNGAT